MAIDGESEVMTVTLKDVADRDLWAVRIEPHIEPHVQKWSRGSGLVRG